MVLSKSHNRKVEKIAAEIKRYISANKKIRFTHGSTNSTRVQDKSKYALIDIAFLDQMIKIDTNKKLAVVEPNVPMDMLVDACLKKGLIPKVVMEFPGITCGGGINGAALEASSFKYGQFNDTCREYELLLGNGESIKANRKKYADIFYGISGSYGSLALVTAIVLELVSAKQYVHVTFKQVPANSIVEEIKKYCKSDYDYVEGLIFDKETALLILGKLTNSVDFPIKTFSKPRDEWFYLYAKKQANKSSETHILLPLKDYLFRYNRGAFWMGKHAFEVFHMPFNRVTRYILNPFMNARTMYKGLHETNVAQSFFIQDFYLPFSQARKFLDLSISKLAIFPIWLCPLTSSSKPQKLSPHFLQKPLIIDIGIWGKIPGDDTQLESVNKAFEAHLKHFGGRKMFYADSFYSEEAFWKIYDKKWYMNLRKKYNAETTFPTIWQKVHTKKRYRIQKHKIVKSMIEAFFTKESVL